MSPTYILETSLGLGVLSLAAAFEILITSASWILRILCVALPSIATKLKPYFGALASFSASTDAIISSTVEPEVRTHRKAKPLPIPDTSFSSTSSPSFGPDSSFSSPDSSLIGYTAMRTINMQYAGRPLSSTPFRSQRRSSPLNPSRPSFPREDVQTTAYSPPFTARSSDTSHTLSLPHIPRAEPKLPNDSDVSSLSLDGRPSSREGSQAAQSSVQSRTSSSPSRQEGMAPLLADLSWSSESSSDGVDVLFHPRMYYRSAAFRNPTATASNRVAEPSESGSGIGQRGAYYATAQQGTIEMEGPAKLHPSKIASPRVATHTAVGSVVLQGSDSTPFQSLRHTFTHPEATSIIIRRPAASPPLSNPLRSSFDVANAGLPPKPSEAVLQAAGYPKINSHSLRPTAEPFRPSAPVHESPPGESTSTPEPDTPHEGRWDEEVSMITSEKEWNNFIPVLIPTVQRTVLTRPPKSGPGKPKAMLTSTQTMEASEVQGGI